MASRRRREFDVEERVFGTYIFTATYHLIDLINFTDHTDTHYQTYITDKTRTVFKKAVGPCD